MKKWWRELMCSYKGHTWLLGYHQGEFIPVTDTCMRCSQRRVILPWGECFNTTDGPHPIAQHYRVTEEDWGIMKVDIVSVGRCAVPR